MEGEKWKRWVNNTYKLEKEIGIPLETELEEMEKKRKELNTLRPNEKIEEKDLEKKCDFFFSEACKPNFP